MDVTRSILYGFVIWTAVLARAEQPARPAAPPVLDARTEPAAYAIYSAVLQEAWKDQRVPILLQQETETVVMGCDGFLPRLTGEWVDVATDFQRQNARARMLQPALSVTVPYHLIPGAEIEADDARLAKAYPGGWQRRPGSMEYWAVSAIGFNRERTKAVLYVRSRMAGGIHRWELKAGKWTEARLEACGWIA
jgi:hypothetical protein